MTDVKIYDPDFGPLHWKQAEARTVIVSGEFFGNTEKEVKFSTPASWEGVLAFPSGSKAELRIDVVPAKEQAITRAARRTCLAIRAKEAEFKLKAASDLLELFNSDWNEGEPINEKQFIERISIRAVSVETNGSALIYFDDGGMFSGHTIEMSVSKKEKIGAASVVG